MHSVFRIALVLMVSLSFTALPSAAAADRHEQLQVGGIARSYTVHLPASAAPSNGYPLVFVFHGGGMQGKGMRSLTGLDALADARGFITVYPDGVDKHWNDGRSTIRNPQDDLAFVSAMIARLEAAHAVDPKRIYATGLSNGALFAERLGCELSHRIAAIAPVAGAMPADIAPACRPERPVAVMQVAGVADPIMPFRGGTVADFGGRGEGGQVLSAPATVELWRTLSGCAAGTGPRKLAPIAPADGTQVFVTNHAGCAATAPVMQVTVVGGGHTWPGGPQYARPLVVGRASRQFEASREIADFFLSLPAR